ANGDRIEASYQEGTQTRSAEARADLIPPIITNISSTNRFGRTVIQWTTDEPANSRILFSTNSNLSLSATNNAFRTEHELVLDNVVPGMTYRFMVISTDVAGNTATNNNGGQFFTFVPAQAKPVLLVNAYTPDDPLFGTQDIPLTAYTDALDQTGVSYEVWDLAERGSPGTNDLRPFRVVMWRLNDSIGSQDTLSPQEQTALQSYLNG